VCSSLKLITYNLIFIQMVLQNTDLKNPVLVLGRVGGVGGRGAKHKGKGKGKGEG